MSVEIIDAIKALHRKRNFAMEQRKRSNLALGSFLRLALGWRMDLPEAERKRIVKQAADWMADGEGPFIDILAASDLARAPYEKIERDCLREMEKLAKQLPIWVAFGEPIRGFGAASLAAIVAEAGDLGTYATEAKLWKRMGLAVIDGARQGSTPRGLSKDQTKDAWIKRGYSPRRRSHMWNIGASLIKQNGDGKYRRAFDARRELECIAHPEWRKGVEPKTGRPKYAMHCHNRAQRYMEKRLLRDLWRAWRRTNEPAAERPANFLSAARLPPPGAVDLAASHYLFQTENRT